MEDHSKVKVISTSRPVGFAALLINCLMIYCVFEVDLKSMIFLINIFLYLITFDISFKTFITTISVFEVIIKID